MLVSCRSLVDRRGSLDSYEPRFIDKNDEDSNLLLDSYACGKCLSLLRDTSHNKMKENNAMYKVTPV